MNYDPNANPFPRTQNDGRVITDEKCECGHRRTQHGNTLAFGHGACGLNKKCGCSRFTWVAMVYRRGKGRR